MAAAITEFIGDLKLRNLQRSTITKHRNELLSFERWLWPQGLDWQVLTYRQIKPYVAARTDFSWQYLRNTITTLRVFYQWATEQEYVSSSPAAGFKTPRSRTPQPRSLTRDQVRELLGALANAEGDEMRDRVLILTGIYAGLRASELGALRWNQVDIAGLVITIPISKMNHGRCIPIHPVLAEVFKQWKDTQSTLVSGNGVFVHTVEGTKHVFSTRYKRASTASMVGKVCQKWSSRTGIKFTSHMLRHTFATWMLRRSGNIYSVSKALGHAQIAQTQIYVSANVEDIRPDVAKLPDLADW
nr:tyrosine-type recombinase/integrase [Oscillochloris sp. ZM17-4]